MDIVDKAMLKYYQVFAKLINPYLLSPSYQIFTIHLKDKKIVNYYLLQWV